MPTNTRSADAEPNRNFGNREWNDPGWIHEREQYLTAFLINGVHSVEELLTLRELCNNVLTDMKTTHPAWIKKPIGAKPPNQTDMLAYTQELGSRIAKVLASIPYLDYDKATDEDSLGMLQISMIQCGFKYFQDADKCYEFFEQHAPLPMLSMDDVPPSRRENKPRNAALFALPSFWLREAPYQLASCQRSKIDQVMAGFMSCSSAEQMQMLKDMGVEVPSDADAAAARLLREDNLYGQDDRASGEGPQGGSEPNQPAVHWRNGGPSVAEATQAMLTQFSAAMLEVVNQTTKAAQKRVKAEVDTSDEEGDFGGAQPDQRLARMLKCGGAAWGKKPRSLQQLQQGLACDDIRTRQGMRKEKAVAPNKYQLLFDQGIDEQTRILVQLEQIGWEKEKVGVTETMLRECKLYETHAHTQLFGLNEKLTIIETCLGLVKAQKHDEAETMYSLYLSEMADKKDSKLVVRLKAESKAKVKEDKELVLLEAVARGMGSDYGRGSGQKFYDEPSAPPAGGKGKGKGKGDGGKGGKGKAGDNQPFVMHWVDGAMFDQSLAGVQCPDPSCFPRYHLARLDSSTHGQIHWAGWGGDCGACSLKGHSHSECPAKRWRSGAQEFANVRWLYTNGFCDAVGAKK